MGKLLEAFHLDNPASLKRATAAGLGGIVVLLAPLLAKWGLPTPSDTQLELFAGIVATFVLQSGVNAGLQAKAAGETAAAKVQTVDDAAKALGGTVQS